MEDLILDFSSDVITIKLSQNFHGKVVVRIFEGNKPKNIGSDEVLYLKIRRTETLISNIMAVYRNDINGFRVSIGSALTENIGEYNASVSIINKSNETEYTKPAKWVVE